MALVILIVLLLICGVLKFSGRMSKKQFDEACAQSSISKTALIKSGRLVQQAYAEEKYWDEPEILALVNGLLDDEPCLNGIRFAPYALNKTPVLNLLLATTGRILNEEGSVCHVRLWPVYTDTFGTKASLTVEQELALAQIMQDELRKNGAALSLGWRPVKPYERKSGSSFARDASVVCEWAGLTVDALLPVKTNVQDVGSCTDASEAEGQALKLLLRAYYDLFDAENRKPYAPLPNPHIRLW